MRMQSSIASKRDRKKKRGAETLIASQANTQGEQTRIHSFTKLNNSEPVKIVFGLLILKQGHKTPAIMAFKSLN